MFMYLVLYFYASDFAIKMKEPVITLRNLTYCLCPENDLSWVLVKKKGWWFTQVLNERNKSKVAAHFLWNVAIWNKKLELLDVACNFLKKRLRQRYFTVNVEKYLRKLFLWNSSKRLFLSSCSRHLCQSLYSDKVESSTSATSLKRDSGTDVFMWILSNFSEHFF